MKVTQSHYDEEASWNTGSAGARGNTSTVYQDGGGNYATGANKIRRRDGIIIGTWNVRIIGQDGKLEKRAVGTYLVFVNCDAKSSNK